MTDHPLRPATHRRLGGPLPHQLANGTRTHRKAEAYAEASFPSYDTYEAHAVLAAVSSCYSSLPGRLSTCYSPVRHFTRIRRPFHVRLACVRHAASVQSEPESNSPVEKYLIQRTEVLKSNSKLYFPNSLFTCQRTAPLPRGGDALCIFCSFLSITFFKVFSERRFRRVSRSRCASARFRVMPIYTHLVKHFFGFFRTFFLFFLQHPDYFICFL